MGWLSATKAPEMFRVFILLLGCLAALDLEADLRACAMFSWLAQRHEDRSEPWKQVRSSAFVLSDQFMREKIKEIINLSGETFKREHGPELDSIHKSMLGSMAVIKSLNGSRLSSADLPDFVLLLKEALYSDWYLGSLRILVKTNRISLDEIEGLDRSIQSLLKSGFSLLASDSRMGEA